MPSDEFLAANRLNWDERVPIHRRDRSGFYAVERFLVGEKRLRAIELGELGDVAGQRLIHLQCHFGLDTPAERPLVFDQTHTYSDDRTPLAATRTYEWIHSLSRIVGALLGAGLTLEFLHEHPDLPWPPFPMCVRGEDGMWRLPDSVPAFPLSVSLRARKGEERLEMP